MERLGCVLALLVVGGCYDGCYEPGKVRGRSSHGSSTAEPQLAPQRFVLDTGDPFITMPALRAVRLRLEGPGVAGSAASIVGDAVQVDVPGAKGSAVAEVLRGGRLDVRAGEALLIRGESLSDARAAEAALVLSFAGTAKAALERAVNAKDVLSVQLDGVVLARFEPQAYDGVARDEGTLSIKMDGDRAKRLAQQLTGKALSHQTKLEQKAIE